VADHWIIGRISTAAASGSSVMPVHAQFGVRALEARPGHTAFGQAMGPALLDAHGRLCPGAFLVAADAALGSSVASALSPMTSIMSLTIHAQFVTLEPGRASDFTVRADAVHVGPESGLSAGEIVGDDGRLIARISGHCGFTPVDAPPSTGASGTAPHPPLNGAQPDSELAPIAVHRAGARLHVGDDGDVRVSASSTPATRNSRGDLQGGVLALLAEQAISACLVRRTPALAQADTMELDITYLRPVRIEEPDVEFVARAEHAGRRFGLAHARAVDGAGRLVVSATGSRYR
jgi:uncharacterized protein (TIGR00369 family)